MKRKVLMILLSIFVLGGCTAKTAEVEQNNKASNDIITVVATLFPQYDFAKAIGGDYVDVKLLLPPGVEAHSFEPTPKDIVDIGNADLLLYTGEGMEPWVADIAATIEGDKLHVVDLSEGISLLKSSDEYDADEHDADEHDADEHDADEHDADEHDADEHDADEHDADEHDHGEYDPHFWLDPTNAIIMAEHIADEFVRVDPDHEAIYRANAAAYIESLEGLDRDLKAFFDATPQKTIIYGGHFAFAYFAERYELDYISPYNGFSPDAEPTPQRIASLIDAIEATHTKAIYYEELISPKVAEVISEETGADMLLLHGAHNVTKEELDAGVTYVSIMYDNLERLKEGLVDE
ncbi:zinc ABC transporter substrate-binding protein [Fusibacter paucivorans]|uniref:Zinc ABC transporter substrate-binding protein n=1 Tax=Fusibacter paucivorans TaxID=76009 RepID=A0ABS5PJ22_9FIRM|nr:zinc ABC transporter substrate-binding protein [Fusibacter paucivorans]MBS7525053.1 zinc ABC transporter substrate-binding protein [Fusibacter paucivorans]